MLTDLIYYDLKVAALVAVFYLFYKLLLARETTHGLNRLVLLAGIGLSAVLPLCIITIHRTVLVEGVLPTATDDAATGDFAAGPAVEMLEHDFDWTLPLAVLLLTGTLARLLYLVRGYVKLHRLIRGGESHTLPSGTQVSVVDAPIVPFSWMQTVVLPRADWQSPSASILAHEEAHVRHRHSYDVVVVEVLTALQWFNPVVWFLRQELRIVHEYQADASVLSRGFDESQYIHLLMQKATGIQACVLATGIHTPKTKKRILMMLKTKSNRSAWLKALYIVPVALVSLALSAETVVDYETVTKDDARAVRLFYEKTNGRGSSYQIRYQPGIKFFRNGREELIPDGRSIALEESKTTMLYNGKPVDQLTLLDLPLGALKEVHLNETGTDRYVCNLLTDHVMTYSAKMNDTEFVVYVKQQQAAGMKQGDVTQGMLNEAGSISRARILHMNSAYGSKKSYLFIVDGEEVTDEAFRQLPPDAIVSAKVMDVGQAKKTYGAKGSRGATVVTTSLSSDPVFDICEQMPQFPGGEGELMKWIAMNIKYPKLATENGVQGRVFVQFIVEKDGRLTSPTIIDSPKSSGASMVVVNAAMTDKQRTDAEAHNAGVQALRDEAIRVINAMPRWTPGKQKGKAVRSKFVLPITYRLN